MGATEPRSHMLEARKFLLGSLFPKVEIAQCRFYKNFILFGECRFYKKFHFVDFSMENDSYSPAIGIMAYTLVNE